MRISRFSHCYMVGAFLVAVAALGALSVGWLASAAPPADALGGTIHPNSSAPSSSQHSTATTPLTTSLASPAVQGALVTLTVQVSPATAVGVTQLKDGTINIGNPVTVSNGTSSGLTSRLALGSPSLSRGDVAVVGAG